MSSKATNINTLGQRTPSYCIYKLGILQIWTLKGYKSETQM